MGNAGIQRTEVGASKGNKEGSAGEEKPRGLIPKKLVKGGCRRTGCSLVVSTAELPGGQVGACFTGKSFPRGAV